MKRILLPLFAVALSASAFADGLSINVPVVGRVTGGGNVLFLTSLDISNNASSTVAVDFYFDGADAKTGEIVSVSGSIGSFGIVGRGGGSLAARTNAHFDDFVDAMVKANLLASTFRDDGVLGSALFVYNGYTKRGQGSVTARFYNAFGGGNVGVSVKGHEIATNEPQKLVATLRDSTGNGSASPVYPNLFINNTGLTPAGQPAPSSVTVQVSAVSATTGQPVGNTQTYTIGAGQVVNLSHAFQVLGVDTTKEDQISVTVTVTSGAAAIEGLVSQVDNVTKDGSAFEMSRADF